MFSNDKDDLERHRIALYLDENDNVTDVWVGESSGDENITDFELQSDHDTYDFRYAAEDN